MRRSGTDDSLRCSFCKKAQDEVGKLIGSPSDYPRAYICDECITICVSIIEDDRPTAAPPVTESELEESPHPLLDHPLASQLLGSVERWIQQESLGADAAKEISEMRKIASRMMAVPK